MTQHQKNILFQLHNYPLMIVIAFMVLVVHNLCRLRISATYFLHAAYIGLRHRLHVAGQSDLTASSHHVDDLGPGSDDWGICEREQYKSGSLEAAK